LEGVDLDLRRLVFVGILKHERIDCSRGGLLSTVDTFIFPLEPPHLITEDSILPSSASASELLATAMTPLPWKDTTRKATAGTTRMGSSR
jgi:hypothetical protein